MWWKIVEITWTVWLLFNKTRVAVQQSPHYHVINTIQNNWPIVPPQNKEYHHTSRILTHINEMANLEIISSVSVLLHCFVKNLCNKGNSTFDLSYHFKMMTCINFKHWYWWLNMVNSFTAGGDSSQIIGRSLEVTPVKFQYIFFVILWFYEYFKISPNFQ